MFIEGTIRYGLHGRRDQRLRAKEGTTESGM